MPSFASQIYASAGRYGLPQAKLRRLASAKPTRALLITLLCLVLIYTFGRQKTSPSSSQTPPQPPPSTQEPPAAIQDARFSLLVPATSSGPDLCKLLLSAQILKYPTPILVNYGATEAEDAYVQHLAKVEGILKYLEGLENTGDYAEDLVLIVDGYDLWFQLGPEILLKRYYELNAAADKKLYERYGEAVVKQNDWRQTVVFGPDKICWPINYERPACWAVTDTNLEDYAFGPETDNFQSRSYPRWLNSGTVLGPVGDLKALFKQTLDDIHANHVIDSDQYYLAEVYGRQEHARLQYRPDVMADFRVKRYGDEVVDQSIQLLRNPPNMTGITKVEYHIGIDFESAIFQTLAFWKQFLVWMKPSDSWTRPGEALGPYALRMPADIEMSPPPFLSLHPTTPAATAWTNVELLYNTITAQIPAMIHFTGEKRFRHIWWKRIWFQPHARALREASVRDLATHLDPFGPVGGYMWHNAVPPEAEEVTSKGVGGAWSDRGGWFPWNRLCKVYEGEIYDVPGDELYHSHLEGEKEPETPGGVFQGSAEEVGRKVAEALNKAEEG